MWIIFLFKRWLERRKGKNFTAAQKQKMLEENMKRNGGVVKSDNPNDFYDILSKSKKSMKERCYTES